MLLSYYNRFVITSSLSAVIAACVSIMLVNSLYENWTSELPWALLVLFLSWLLWRYFTTPNNLPPGPWGIPICGYIPFLGDKLHITLRDLSKKYGDVCMVSLGPVSAIVLSSYNVIKEALVRQADVFSARPTKFNTVTKDFHETPGIIGNNGESWLQYRRFSLQTLKDFGFGRATLEPQLTEEIQRFLDVVKSANGKPMNIGEFLRKSVTNVICTIISGHRMEYDSSILNQLLDLTKQSISNTGLGRLEMILPPLLLKPLVIRLLGLRSPRIAMMKMSEILSDIVDKRDALHQPGSQDNFIDCWLTEMKKQGEKSTYLNKKQLPSVLRDLFIAGSDTTTNTLTWGLLYMAKYPNIQEKIQIEIDEVIGKERTPTMSDQKNMPYTDATLMEINRIASIVPLSVVHSSVKDTILNGYFIPKDSLVIPNLWAVHHDPVTFPEPDQFKPERFLIDNQQISKIEELIPFSIGKRQCMGEMLARMELFLYFTSILQQLTIKKVDGFDLDFSYSYAAISVPKAQKMCAVLR